MLVEVEQEQDGRWIAEVPVIPGAMAYGSSRQEAVAKVEVFVLRILADKVEHGEEIGPKMLSRIARHTGLSPEDL
jgi:predicted RNase H-like HicB family nuclease